MRELLDALSQALDALVKPGEWACASLQAESSDFVRLNGARIRQAGRVERAVAHVRLIQGDRQAIHQLTLPGLKAGVDALRTPLDEALQGLRAAIRDSEADPLLDVNREAVVLDDRDAPAPGTAHAPDFDREAFIDAVAGAAGDADLVGFCAAGPVARGWCSTGGARLWHQRHSVAFDWSVHLPPEQGTGERKAVKSAWSGPRLDLDAVAAAIATTRRDAQVMTRPVRRLSPGDYRVLLSPRALADLLEMLSWGGFSARAHQSGQSPLALLREGRESFSSRLSLTEDLRSGLAPRFQSDGYLRPDRVPLIDQGRFADWLVSPASAREYHLKGNAAGPYEAPDALVVAPGTLAAQQALPALGRGLSLSNLWYLNFSDRLACRITGMTRFACLWVEDGEPVSPVEAMRFDDSLYRVLGEHLEALGDTVRVMPATDTYDGRATGGIAAPSALISSLRLAL